MEWKRISCYRNGAGEILLMPWVKIGYGSMPTSKLLLLPAETSDEELGAQVRLRTEFCNESFLDASLPSPHITATGAKTIRMFTKKWDCVVVYFDEVEIRIMPTSKDSRGAYGELFRETTTCELGVSNQVLGDKIRDTFASCKLGERGY